MYNFIINEYEIETCQSLNVVLVLLEYLYIHICLEKLCFYLIYYECIEIAPSP